MIRPLTEGDLDWAEAFLGETLAGRLQARRGELVDVLDSEGFIAEHDGERLGLLTYRWSEEGCELAAVAVCVRRRGVGTELVDALVREVGGRARIWLVTSNDNLDALRFYQRRGFRLAALRAGAIDDSRRLLKPAMPEVGSYGIPMHDELELELPAGATVGG